MECGSLFTLSGAEGLPLFLFPGSHFGFASPEQPKSRPLESRTYEMQISKSFPLTFIRIGGGKGCRTCFPNQPLWSAGALLPLFPGTSKLFRGNEQPVCLHCA